VHTKVKYYPLTLETDNSLVHTNGVEQYKLFLTTTEEILTCHIKKKGDGRIKKKKNTPYCLIPGQTWQEQGEFPKMPAGPASDQNT